MDAQRSLFPPCMVRPGVARFNEKVISFLAASRGQVEGASLPSHRRSLPMRSIPLVACALALGAAATARSQTLPQFPLPSAYFSFDRCLSSGGVRAMDDVRIWNPGGSENAYHPTLRNGASCGSGRFGSGGFFDGIDDVADTAVDVDFTDALTVSAWVYPRNTGRWQTIVNKWYTPDAWGLFIEPGYFNFSIAQTSGYRTVRQPATPNQWTHVAVVFTSSPSQMRMYINGVATPPVSVFAQPINDSGRPIAVGGHPSWNAFDGWIDEVKIWNRALNATQVAQAATTPSGVADRGVHLYSSQWAANPGDATHGWHVRDLSLLQTIGNLNSVKSTIFSYREFGGTDYANLHQVQRNKLTQLKAAAGNHQQAWVFRAWPNPGDFQQPGTYFDKGHRFAQNLASVFHHLQTSLQLQNVVIEVANEPNISTEGFADASGWPNLSYYNDFFRGFYWGMRAVGYSFPLAYAGLSPGDFIDQPGLKRFNSTVWYQDVNTQNHIRDYASKVGVHVYWMSGARMNTNEGKYYREIHDILAGAGVPRRGLIATEFNGVRSSFANPSAQITDACVWWREFQNDAVAYWTEQATIYISHADDANDQAQYELSDAQLDPIRNCR
jgi:hypothetical protein